MNLKFILVKNFKISIYRKSSYLLGSGSTEEHSEVSCGSGEGGAVAESKGSLGVTGRNDTKIRHEYILTQKVSFL